MTAPTSPRTSVRNARTTVCALPSPAERRRLREAWDLTPQQLAAAFGITPATVRSWESGRTSPTGRRRVAYARFLLGLSQQLTDTAGRDGTTGPAVPEPRRGRTHGLPVTVRPTPPPLAAGRLRYAPSPVPRPAPPAPRPVRRTDPVAAGRRRRLRYAACAWGAWALALYVLFTMPAAG